MRSASRIGALLNIEEETLLCSNSQENWDLLNESGIHFWTDWEGLYDMKIQTDDMDDLQKLTDLLNEKSSNP